MENMIGALVVATATGIAFIAYRHPKTYNRVLVWLLLSTLAFAFFVAFVWDLAASQTYVLLLPLIPMDKMDEASARLESIHALRGWTAIGGGAAVFFLLMLRLIEYLLPEKGTASV